MLRGFKAEKCLFFTVDGRPTFKGATKFEDGRKVHTGEAKANYWKTFKHIATIAAREQGWEVTDKPVYFSMNIYLGVYGTRGKRQEEESKNIRFAAKEPGVPYFFSLASKALKGIAYVKETQIIASQIHKEYDKDEQRVEVFIGIPKNWEGVEYDLSKIE